MMAVAKIKPLGKRILIRRADKVSSHGRIILPDSAKEQPKEGEVVSVGPGEMKDDGTVVPLDLKVGDRVLFGAFAGSEVEVDEESEYLIMSEDDVLAVIG